MNKPRVIFKSVVPQYQFLSDVQLKGAQRITYMHVIANGSKFDNLQKLLEKNLTVTSKQLRNERFVENVHYRGSRNGGSYEVILEVGTCPTLDGGQGHNIEIRSRREISDVLSPIVEEEMKKYETEMTEATKRAEAFCENR